MSSDIRILLGRDTHLGFDPSAAAHWPRRGHDFLTTRPRLSQRCRRSRRRSSRRGVFDRPSVSRLSRIRAYEPLRRVADVEYRIHRPGKSRIASLPHMHLRASACPRSIVRARLLQLSEGRRLLFRLPYELRCSTRLPSFRATDWRRTRGAPAARFITAEGATVGPRTTFTTAPDVIVRVMCRPNLPRCCRAIFTVTKFSSQISTVVLLPVLIRAQSSGRRSPRWTRRSGSMVWFGGDERGSNPGGVSTASRDR
jgi:hypothetical protein